MAEHVFESPVVEEFYNSCHTKHDGTFCGKGRKGKGIHRVPMSAAARQSNALLRGMSAARKSKDYKTAAARIKGTWANREHSQGGLGRGRGTGSRAADSARAKNAVKGANTRKGNPNKDKSTPLRGSYKTTGNKSKDAIKLTQLDRGSPERKAAAKAFERAYGSGKLSVQQKQARGIPVGSTGTGVGGGPRTRPLAGGLASQRKQASANQPKRWEIQQKELKVGGSRKATPAVRKQFDAARAAWAKNPTKETKDKVRDFLNKYDL